MQEIISYKPQSHFNEAKLTAIALAVRFAAITTVAITPGSFLALDDMLISLDMSNRMKVIKYLLNKIAPTYKCPDTARPMTRAPWEAAAAMAISPSRSDTATAFGSYRGRGITTDISMPMTSNSRS